jgi:DNA invertase Pin-like site-specific DNA recombinase
MEQLPVAGYFRVSHARDDMHAPRIYADEIERFCSYKDLELAQVYSDIDFSGWRDSKPRPSLELLLRQRSRYSAVVIPKLSRFARSVTHLTHLFDLFDKDGISLVFLDMNVDTGTSQGRLLRNVMAAFAEYESDVKSDYARAAHRHLASLGRPHGGNPPYGYENDCSNKTYTIIPDQAVVVREIFERYVARESATSICEDLNGRGIPTSKGSIWHTESVTRTIDKLAYAGFRRIGAEAFPATWPAIVSMSLWESARELRVSKRAARGSTRPSGPAAPKYLLSRLIHCGLCGRVLHHRPNPNGKQGSFYLCPKRRRGDLSPNCPGGGIAEHRAHRFVTDAFFDSYWCVLLERTGVDVRARWHQADLEERRNLLGQAIRRIELVPRETVGQKGAPRFRKLRIEWSAWSELSEGSVVAVTETPSDLVDSKACEHCGRRLVARQFKKMPGGERSGVCGACRRQDSLTGIVSQPPPIQPLGAERLSWPEWQRRFRQLRG